MAHPPLDSYLDAVKNIPASECIRLLDSMGTDARVVNAARVSLDRWIDEGKDLTEGDKRLISYLAGHDHVTPFFHPMVTLYIKMPIFVAREWFRHTVGLSRNEVSRRYVDGPVECFVPTMIRERHPSKKQGSKDTPIEANDECMELMKKSMEDSVKIYRELLKKGTAPEIARMVLPQSMMTMFIETGSLAAYARIYKLRFSPDAQVEIQSYAAQVGEIMSKKYPAAWKALTSPAEP